MENKINTRIVPMLLELGYKDNRTNRNNEESKRVYISAEESHITTPTIWLGAIEIGEYVIDGEFISGGKIQFDEVKLYVPELLPVFEEIQKIIDEEK